MRSRAHDTNIRRQGIDGSAIIAVLSVLALLSLLLVALMQSVTIERSTSKAFASELQARLSAESGIAAAFELLKITTSNHPAYLVGFPPRVTNTESVVLIVPPVVIGASNLTNGSQIAPLFSYDLKTLSSYPNLPKDNHEYPFQKLLERRSSTNSSLVVDLNDPLLIGIHDATTNLPSGGMISPSGHYPALWQSLRDGTGEVIGRYTFILTDESARLNPSLHSGNPRTDATNWDQGPKDIPLSNGNLALPSPQEAELLKHLAEKLPTEGSFETAFPNKEEYLEKRILITRDPCLVPDLIPSSLAEGGRPKYNLNDLATNPAWGATPCARASNIAAIIDRNLPQFKKRDASLANKSLDQTLYTQRLACSIVDYISKDQGPTSLPSGEPSGRDLVPYVTQIAERCTRTSLNTNTTPYTTAIESRFFVEVWNPTTSTIKGGIPRLLIGNRARVKFGTALQESFRDYDEQGDVTPEIRPNELIVLAFPPETQQWNSPIRPTNGPSWTEGPTGNSNNAQHQNFSFYWNGKLVDMSRRPPISPGKDYGGLQHYGQTLSNTTPQWQVFTIPTYSGKQNESEGQESADQAIQFGKFTFVGDPGAGFLTAYTWSSTTNYPNSLWKGINPASLKGAGYLIDPERTWTSRDRVPVNPVTGKTPSSLETTPDAIPSPYVVEGNNSLAPFFVRKGAINSLGELGNIFDPAQVNDQGGVTNAGNNKSMFCYGGGRTLRIGQPESRYINPALNWDVPGKRAVELLDLFTVADRGREQGGSQIMTNAGIPGRINVNTASHAVLTTLFSGIQVTSDRRFTNSSIGAKAADDLASFLEEHRPYNKLSDLSVLTTNLVNANIYIPPLSRNVPGSSPQVADVFDRAREESFGKMIGHCVVQSRTFRIHVIGESLDRRGKTTGRTLMEGLIRLTPDATGRLVPSLHDVEWR
jgi:hypothetical protein